MPKKQVALFIVEGVNDETALALPLERLLTTEHVKFEITNGDVTSNYYGKNIAARIGDCVKKHCEEYKYKIEDFAEVVLLTDMDGAFLDAESILKDDLYGEPYYDTDCIICNNPEMLYQSHVHKQQNLNRLISLPNVYRRIPFSVYFFSCNLDHVICNNANMPQNMKSSGAEAFRKRFHNDPNGLLAFFSSEGRTVGQSYYQSWEYIKEGTNSLKRCSNLSIYLSPDAIRISRDFSYLSGIMK